MMATSDILRKIRSELGLTQEDFARQLSTTVTTVNRWENDKASPNRMAKSLLIDFCIKNNIKQELIDELGKIR